MSLNLIENPTKIQKITLKMPDKSTNSIENQPKIQQFHWKSKKNPTIPLKIPQKNSQQNLKLINQVGDRVLQCGCVEEQHHGFILRQPAGRTLHARAGGTCGDDWAQRSII